MRNASEEEAPREGLGVVPTGYAIFGPKTVPRVDHERIFVLDGQANLLGEYALRDECPLEYADLKRSIPVSGMRHLVSFYQGEYAFTPFRVDDIWFVVLTRGVPRIEDRGSIGTLLAAMRLHLPTVLAPALAEREAVLRRLERDLDEREASLIMREQRVALRESELHFTNATLRELEVDVLARENKLNALRDYAVRMQIAFRNGEPKPPMQDPKERSPHESDASGGPSP